MKHLRIISILCMLCLCVSLAACGGAQSTASSVASSAPAQDFTAVPQAPQDTAKLKYRAMWISYLDWDTCFDTSSAAAFEASADATFKKCADMGLNCVIVQVRPFADATYKSDIFPWSYLVSSDGTAPAYDPLEILINSAHAQRLAFEAWVNPYRVTLNSQIPGFVSEQSPAALHPEWVESAIDGTYFNPAIPEVQQLIIDGVTEIVTNYNIEGIQFDDYFYPTTDSSFDSEEYLAYANGAPLDEWRRSNVNTLVSNVYKAIKAVNSSVVFGISPQGNNDNNYGMQYSDVAMWLSTPGYVDYIMPQLYWGFDYTTSGGSSRFAFNNLIREWAAMPRDESVSLAMGLGAFRMGSGDGGSNSQAEWQSGHNLADMTNAMDEVDGIDGFALFRYEFMFNNIDYPELSRQETAALTEKYAKK